MLRLCYINRVQLRLQLRDETALQLLPKFCWWAATASCHLGYLDTLDAKHLDNTRHPLDTLDTLRHARHPRHPRHPSTLLDTDKHGFSLDRPRQASTGLDRPRHLYFSTAARHPRHRASTPRHQGSALIPSPSSDTSTIGRQLRSSVSPITNPLAALTRRLPWRTQLHDFRLA